MKLQNVTDSLLVIRNRLVILGKLQGLAALKTENYNTKLTITDLAFSNIYFAREIENLIDHTYAINTPLFYLDALNRNRIEKLVDTEFSIDILSELTKVIKKELCYLVGNLSKALFNNISFISVSVFLKKLANCYKYEHSELNNIFDVTNVGVDCHRDFYGPKHGICNSIFKPSYELLEQNSPEFSDNLLDATPYYWCLSSRESNAADMCLLTVFEYSGVPVDFYFDILKQAADEMRHAIFFMNIAKQLLPEYISMLTPKNQYYQGVKTYLETGSGLPIPKASGLYESLWDANVEERLILMHIDTEGPGIARIREKINSTINKQYHAIADGLEVVMREEATHLRLGNKWLKYFIPDEKNRNRVIENTRNLRGLFVLDSISCHASRTLLETLSKII